LDITTFIGILVAGGLVISSILIGGSGSWCISYPALTPLLTHFARKARQEGILAFENEIEALDDLYISRGLQWAIEGSDTDHSDW